jgi:hypothetical protein
VTTQLAFVPWEELDPPIRPLVRVLNDFEDITTLGSCAGHTEPGKGGQWRDGEFYVSFTVAHTEAGWRALEFLAWFVNEWMRLPPSPWHVRLYPTSGPPYLNEPGETLYFALEGDEGGNPEAFAAELQRAVERCYVPVEAP